MNEFILIENKIIRKEEVQSAFIQENHNLIKEEQEVYTYVKNDLYKLEKEIIEKEGEKYFEIVIILNSQPNYYGNYNEITMKYSNEQDAKNKLKELLTELNK